MQRNTSLWVYFVSLLLAAGMTFALLPACSGGSDSGCNSEIEDEDGCEAEETAEEDVADGIEAGFEDREETGGEESAVHFLEDVEDPSFAAEEIEHEAEDAREIAP